MANFQTHIATSSVLGVLYGTVGYTQLQFDWGQAALAAGLTAAGGMLPDLDSESGIPVREIFGLAGVLAPLLFLHRLAGYNLGIEKMVVIGIAIYFMVRFCAAELFNRVTVHRGMFHSIPAMLIVGLIVHQLYANRPSFVRHYMGIGAMIGFASHLVLDEIYAVNLVGLRIKFNKFAGSALKLYSSSWPASGLTYAILAGLGWLYGREQDFSDTTLARPPVSQTIRPDAGPIKKAINALRP